MNFEAWIIVGVMAIMSVFAVVDCIGSVTQRRINRQRMNNVSVYNRVTGDYEPLRRG